MPNGCLPNWLRGFDSRRPLRLRPANLPGDLELEGRRDTSCGSRRPVGLRLADVVDEVVAVACASTLSGRRDPGPAGAGLPRVSVLRRCCPVHFAVALPYQLR